MEHVVEVLAEAPRLDVLTPCPALASLAAAIQPHQAGSSQRCRAWFYRKLRLAFCSW